MRIWHKHLISALPRKQLISQWRECCAIAKNIHDKGTPNHALVNKVQDYCYLHLLKYGYLIVTECKKRGYKISPESIKRFEENILSSTDKFYGKNEAVEFDNLFDRWHTKRYLIQCYYNLQEKYDCDMISIDEYFRILDNLDFISD